MANRGRGCDHRASRTRHYHFPRKPNYLYDGEARTGRAGDVACNSALPKCFGASSLRLAWIQVAEMLSTDVFAFSGNGSRRSRAVSYSFEVEFTHNWD